MCDIVTCALKMHMRGKGNLFKKLWLIIIFCIIFVAVGVLYAVFITPPSLFEAPDESGHFSYIHYIQAEKKLPVLHETNFYESEIEIAEDYLEGIDDYSVYEIRDDFVPNGPNWIVQHPVAYYALMSPVLALGRIFTDKLVYLIYLIRIATVLLGLVFVIYCYKLLKLLKRNNYFIAVFLSIIVFSPMIQYYFSVVSNESLVILLSMMSLYYLVKFQKFSKKSDMILFTIFANLILLTKYTGALILLPYGAFLIYLLIKKFKTREIIFSLLICIGISLVISGPFLMRNIHIYDKLLPTKNQIYTTSFDYGIIDFFASGYINEIYKHLCNFVGWVNFIGTDIYVRYFYCIIIGIGPLVFSFLKHRENNLGFNKKRYIIVAGVLLVVAVLDAVWGYFGRYNLGLYVIITLVGLVYGFYHLIRKVKAKNEHDTMMVFFIATILFVVLGFMYTHFNLFNRNGFLIATHGRYYLLLAFPFIYLVALMYDNYLNGRAYYKYIVGAVTLLCILNEAHIISYLIRLWH